MDVSTPTADQSSTTDAATSQRIELSRDMQAELMQIWNIAAPYRVTITVFPSDDVYDALPSQAVPGTNRRGAFCTKTVVRVAGAHDATWDVVTAYCPSEKSNTHRCPSPSGEVKP